MPTVCPGPAFPSGCPLGARQFLDQLWSIIGNSFDWSLALHRAHTVLLRARSQLGGQPALHVCCESGFWMQCLYS